MREQPATAEAFLAALPTPAQAMAACEELSSLVASMNAPGPGAFANTGRPSAASITLRLDGQIVARSTTSGPECVLEAARQVIEAMNQRSRPPREAVGSGPPQRPILPGLDSERVRVSLELAGPLVPITPKTFDEADERLAPGLDGVCVRVGERTELVFPGTMLTLNISPGDALATASAAAAGDPTFGVRGSPDGEPGVVAKNRGAVFYRFRVVHLANPEPGAPSIFLYRGGKLVRERDISTTSLRLFADSMAQNLVGRRCAEGAALGMVGTPLPTLGRFEREFASPVEQALAALALARYSAGGGPGGDASLAPLRESARARAAEILDRLACVEAGERDPSARFACAALAASVFDDPKNIGLPREVLTDRALAFLERCQTTLDAAARSIDASPEDERSVVGYALARRAARTARPEDVDAAERAVREVLGRTPPSHLVNQMPWIGWAELAIADRRGGPVASAAALREMRETVFSRVLSVDAAGPDGADLVGGIVFASSGPPMPTWQSARPLAFLATMLGDRRLTDEGEVVKEQARLLPSLRFLRQLAADDAAGHMCLKPREARGGIRAAAWDQRQPADATSLTLLAVCEALGSLGRR